jgi:hypothetical protein
VSGNQVAPPRLPEAPEEYTRSYMQDLIRTLEIFIEQERNPGEIRATSVTITDLPTSATGLATTHKRHWTCDGDAV